MDSINNMSIEELKGAVEKLKAENSMRETAIKSLNEYSASVKIDNKLTSKPGSFWVDPNESINKYYDNVIYSQLMMPGATWTTTGMAEVTQEIKDADKRLQLKLFIHFAKLFVEKFPKWSLVPESDDPFGKVKLVRPDIGASITSLYPMNELAVYGGPDLWTNEYRELGQTLPIVKVQTQKFFGWALDIDTPEWVR